MIPRLVADIQKAIDNSCYFSALALALTLPDICGKAAYPNESRGSKRYIDWYEEVVGITEKPPDEDDEMPYLSGSVVYQLRCAFLHQGTPNPNIAKNKIREECCRTNEFSLILSKDNFSDCSSVSKIFSKPSRLAMPFAPMKWMFADYASSYLPVPMVTIRKIKKSSIFSTVLLSNQMNSLEALTANNKALSK